MALLPFIPLGGQVGIQALAYHSCSEMVLWLFTPPATIFSKDSLLCITEQPGLTLKKMAALKN